MSPDQSSTFCAKFSVVPTPLVASLAHAVACPTRGLIHSSYPPFPSLLSSAFVEPLLVLLTGAHIAAVTAVRFSSTTSSSDPSSLSPHHTVPAFVATIGKSCRSLRF
ncbi:hypothetical protein BOTBODRAFT_172977 [Botryobasidium botryosum FD-172 SS1]|uniref:Uncharacterized protein n=1 Tax=Botryobasidium botryosum (strain FD-172 SS1) TaxID=930990 RepID=A0A067MX47_BOTB1|nr:hypothetical protein BOTBODRAFT_172977 [Botryobasidium botryosum FD-172 SS1]